MVVSVAGGIDDQVFMPWEGVAAQQSGLELNVFKLEDYNIPYGYSPVLAAHPDILKSQPDLVRSFLAASARGFEFAAQHPEEAAELLLAEVAKDVEASGKPLPTPLDPSVVQESQKLISKCYLDQGNKGWGVMDIQQWSKFLDWLSVQGLLSTKVQSRGPRLLQDQCGSCDTNGSLTTTLDGLREGDVGENIPRSALSADALATNAYLPQQH
jgi:ABC-type nitrate/sulfonate/bicarbonate transport system substrate-binding protein